MPGSGTDKAVQTVAALGVTYGKEVLRKLDNPGGGRLYTTRLGESGQAEQTNEERNRALIFNPSLNNLH